MNSNENLIAPCDTYAKFFDDNGIIGSSPNSLAGKNPEINDDAVFSLLQFGAIIPPLSPWKRIHRFVPGYRYQGTKIVGPVELQKHQDIATLNLEQRVVKVEQVLDEVLKKNIGDSEEDPVLLFSGGVDSGLIASRLAALGYRNSLLINFSFGDNDFESKLAEKMASELGLPFMRVFSQNADSNCLENPGKIYPQPFGDHSTVPTSDLAKSVVKYLSNQKRIIIDGTGADGAFGMGAQIKDWKKVYRIPVIARKIASLAYEKMLWHRQGRFESTSRILLRSVQMPMLSAMLADNPLSTTFYNGASRHFVDDLLKTWVEGWAGSHTDMRIVAGDLALTCSNIFAQKAQPIFNLAGHKMLYPFLENEMVSMALSSAPHWQMEEPKAILKRALARKVPHKMVYRAKSGFTDPKLNMFFDEKFIDYLRCVAEPTSPIAHMIESKLILRVCDLLSQKKEMPPQTLNFIWTAVFTDRWYRTA